MAIIKTLTLDGEGVNLTLDNGDGTGTTWAFTSAAGAKKQSAEFAAELAKPQNAAVKAALDAEKAKAAK